MTERPKMNQRFGELKKQAHEYAVDQEWYIDSFEQRFAELIVRECCQVVADIPVDALEPDYRILADHFGIDFERDWS